MAQTVPAVPVEDYVALLRKAGPLEELYAETDPVLAQRFARVADAVADLVEHMHRVDPDQGAAEARGLLEAVARELPLLAPDPEE